MPGFPTKIVGTPKTGGKPFWAPFEAQGKQVLQMQLRGGGMMFVGVWGRQESDAEIALIADRAAEGACEKDGVKDVLPESSSSGFVVSVTPATRTNGRLIEVRHDYSSRSWLGSNIVHPIPPNQYVPTRFPGEGRSRRGLPLPG